MWLGCGSPMSDNLPGIIASHLYGILFHTPNFMSFLFSLVSCIYTESPWEGDEHCSDHGQRHRTRKTGNSLCLVSSVAMVIYFCGCWTSRYKSSCKTNMSHCSQLGQKTRNSSHLGGMIKNQCWRSTILVLLRKTGFFDGIYTHVYGKTKFRLKKKMYLSELSGSKFHSITSSNVILYNDVKNSIFIKSGFIWFWKLALQFMNLNG